MKISPKLLTSFALALSPAGAATLESSTFASEGLFEARDLDVTGPSVADWGYFVVDNEFLPGVVDNRKASSDIGPVTITPGDLATATFMWSDTLPKFTMTFTDGTDPAEGTIPIGSGFGAWAPNENNAATFTFEDLGAGTHTVRVFVGHSSNDRIFNMDYTVTAADGDLTGNTVSPPINSGDLHSTYEIVFSTNDPEADLSLQFNSTSGGTGSGWIAGYVVETDAAAAGPILVPGAVSGEGESRELELTLEGAPGTTYVLFSSPTLDFTPGDPVLNLSQADSGNDPGTIAGPDDREVTTDENGLALFRMAAPAEVPVNFLRAQALAPGGN